MNFRKLSPIEYEEKQYIPPKENPVNFAPHYGTNTKMPGPYDYMPVDMPDDKKIDITEVEVKPIVQDIEEQNDKRALMAQAPNLFEVLAYLGIGFYIMKLVFGSSYNNNIMPNI